jgi:hypothetical protein
MRAAVRISLRLVVSSIAAFGALSIVAGVSVAAITVNLRVEGSSKTLFEGPIGTEAILNPPGLSTEASGGPHPCDVKDNGGNGGFGVEAATPTGALHSAAVQVGLPFNAKWSSSFNDFFVTQFGPDVEGGAPEFASWGYAVDYTTAGVGGCQFQLAPGNEVLWAYNYFNLKHLMRLTGPLSASVGTPFTVHVTDGQTGAPISGAAIGELSEGVTTSIPGATTNASGDAAITLSSVGGVTLKATGAESVRSNGLPVCVHNGNDGNCGTVAVGGSSATTAPTAQTTRSATLIAAIVAKIEGIQNGRTYRRRRAPRILRGVAEPLIGGAIRDVRIRLERRYHGHCLQFSGSRERFVRVHCGRATFFSVGASQSFSYLLPAPLARGSYVFELEAIDASGHATKLVPGVSRVVFKVA